MRTLIAACLLIPGALASQGPEGWTFRLDAAQQMVSSEPAEGQWAFARMPPGWHVTTTDQGVVLYAEEPRLTGTRWGVEVELFLFPNPSDEALGIAFQPAGPHPEDIQLLFLMRRDGQAAMIGRMASRDTVVVDWTSDTAATPHSGDVDRYVLRVTYEERTLAFAINGREMLTFQVGGGEETIVPGLRVGPGLNVHVARYDLITPLAPPRPRRSGG